MNPSIFKKQPWEERQLEFDISNALALGDSLSASGTPVVEVLLGDTIQPAMVGTPSKVGNKVYCQIKGGINGVDYSIRVRVQTTNSDKIEDEITLQVRDT
jgi:hypothetical protein